MLTWLITGCSSGLGRALAEVALERGANVVVTARNIDAVKDLPALYPDRARAVEVDVRNPEHLSRAVRVAEDTFGGLDVLVNNAGHGYRAAVEEGDTDDVEDLFATNLFGPVALIKTVLPNMRARRSGTILNISSIGGRRANAGSGYYSATKFGLEAISDALRKEVGPLGIRVVVVEPGAFRTEFAGRSLQQSSGEISDYAATSGARRKEHDTSHGSQPGDPRRAAHVLVDLVAAPTSPFRLLLGTDAVAMIRGEVSEQLAEIDNWEETSVSTDFPA